MRLSKLKAAINAAPNVYLRSTLFGLIALQKGSVKEAIERKFSHRNDETGLKLDEEFAFIQDTEPSEPDTAD